MNFDIRRATSGDDAAIVDCMREAFAPYKEQYTPGAFEDTVPDSIVDRLKTMTVFVATYDDQIIGTISCDAHGHLRGMAVRAAWRGKGVAAKLIHAAEDALRKQQCKLVTLDTTEPLARARHFYEKHGYRKSGRTSDFFGMTLTEYVKPL
jgi:predicted N-acetyltransferase YhbS